jgi:hypothetical protein
VTLILPRVANDVVGRAEIQHTLAAALDGAVDGRAATLVVEGEAGSGKTLLMQWLMEHAAERGVLTVAARPVEGEAQLPLAVMTDVLRPLRGWAPRLLPEQRDVLEAAAGGVGEASTDRLLLAAATLALLAAVAEDTPVLLVVDDAHWADPTSGRALSFALRRLLADRVLAVLTRRPTEELRIAGPWEPLELRGLTEPDIAALIEVRTGVTPPPGVVERIRDETLGNPLAVSHLAERLPVDALAGASPLPITLPLQEVARRTFAGLVRALPAGTRSALTVVAAAGSAAARIAPSALRVCGLDVDDLGPAEEAGLITGGSGSVEFGHPLYRATALEVAGAAAVRRAHAALAEAARGRDPQRHAWHLGLSVLGTDEAAAAVVEAAAAAAERRVGAAATVGMRALAVTLSPPGPGCDRRELDSVRALVAAGHHAEARDRLQQLLDADGIADDVRADAFHQLARLMLWDTPLDSQPVAAHIPDDLPPRQMSATLAVAALRARNMAELRRFGDLARAAHEAIRPLADGTSPTNRAAAAPAPRTPAPPLAQPTSPPLAHLPPPRRRRRPRPSHTCRRWRSRRPRPSHTCRRGAGAARRQRPCRSRRRRGYAWCGWCRLCRRRPAAAPDAGAGAACSAAAAPASAPAAHVATGGAPGAPGAADAVSTAAGAAAAVPAPRAAPAPHVAVPAPRAAFAAVAAAAAGSDAVVAAADAAVAAAGGVVDDAGVAADVAETLVLLPTLSLVAESELVVGEHRGSAVDDAVARVRRLLAAARGAEPTASAVRRGLVAMLDDLAGSPAQMLTWTSAIDLADELLTLWLSAARARPASVAYLLMARTELSGWTGDLRGGLAAADRAIEVSEEVGSHALTGWTHVFAARLCAAAGNEQDCLAHRDAGIALGDRSGRARPARLGHARPGAPAALHRPGRRGRRGAHAGGRDRERDRVRGRAGDPLAARLDRGAGPRGPGRAGRGGAAELGGHPARRARRMAPRHRRPHPGAGGRRVGRRRAAQRVGGRRAGRDPDRGGARPARRRVRAAPTPQARRVAGHAEAGDGDVRPGRCARLAGCRGERAHRSARAGRPRPHRWPHRAGDAGGAGDRGGRDQPAGRDPALLQPQDDRVPPHARVRQARRTVSRRAGGPDGDPGAARGGVTST